MINWRLGGFRAATVLPEAAAFRCRNGPAGHRPRLLAPASSAWSAGWLPPREAASPAGRLGAATVGWRRAQVPLVAATAGESAALTDGGCQRRRKWWHRGWTQVPAVPTTRGPRASDWSGACSAVAGFMDCQGRSPLLSRPPRRRLDASGGFRRRQKVYGPPGYGAQVSPAPAAGELDGAGGGPAGSPAPAASSSSWVPRKVLRLPHGVRALPSIAAVVVVACPPIPWFWSDLAAVKSPLGGR